MPETIGVILIALVLLAGAVAIGYLTIKMLWSMLRSLSNLISVLADLVTYAVVLFTLHGLIPLHFSSGFWDWIAYILVTGGLSYYLIKLRLVEYSANYTGIALMFSVVIGMVRSRPFGLAVSILMPILARLCWISSRFVEGQSLWIEDSRDNFGGVTEIRGHYEYMSGYDGRKKSEEDLLDEDRFMLLQIIVAGILYAFCTSLSFGMALDNKGSLSISGWWLLFISIVGAVVNLLIDVFVMKKVDQRIDGMGLLSFDSALANME